MSKKLSKGEVATAKELDSLKSRTFKLRFSEIIHLDNKAHELKLSKSVMVRRALKELYGINAIHRACDVDFDYDDQ